MSKLLGIALGILAWVLAAYDLFNVGTLGSVMLCCLCVVLSLSLLNRTRTPEKHGRTSRHP